MRKVPDSFKESLDKQFNGKIRVRWSNKDQEWHVEEKINRGSLDTPVDDQDDTAIRYRDGYGFICSIRPGDRMPCPKCNSELKVPINEFAEVKCDYCRMKGRNTSIISGFFELGDILLEHLRRLDPVRGWRDKFTYETYDEHRQRIIDKQIENMSPIWSDNYRRLVGIPQVGWRKTAYE